MSDNTLLRESHFMSEVRRRISRAVAERRRPVLTEICRQAARAKAPGYYVSFDYARRRLREVVSDDGTRLTPEASADRSERGRMMAEIARKCLRRRLRRPGLSLSDALTQVLAFSTASCFFMSDAYALKVYYKNIRLHRALRRAAIGRRRQRTLF